MLSNRDLVIADLKARSESCMEAIVSRSIMEAAYRDYFPYGSELHKLEDFVHGLGLDAGWELTDTTEEHFYFGRENNKAALPGGSLDTKLDTAVTEVKQVKQR